MGADPDVVTAIARHETGGKFDPTIRPLRKDGSAMSTGRGLGQFTNRSWLAAIRTFGRDHGIGRGKHTTKEEAEALRLDVGAQAAMLASWTSMNSKLARDVYGDSPAATYAFHLLGQGNGTRFLRGLKANPDAAVDSVLPSDVISLNPSIFRDARTLGEAFGAMGHAMGGVPTWQVSAAPMVRLPAATVSAVTVSAPPPPTVRPPPVMKVPDAAPPPAVSAPAPASAPAPVAPLRLLNAQGYDAALIVKSFPRAPIVFLIDLARRLVNLQLLREQVDAGSRATLGATSEQARLRRHVDQGVDRSAFCYPSRSLS